MLTDHDQIGFNNYISPAIVGPCPLRPRPIVLMVSRDVPSYAAHRIIESLLSNLQVRSLLTHSGMVVSLCLERNGVSAHCVR